MTDKTVVLFQTYWRRAMENPSQELRRTGWPDRVGGFSGEVPGVCEVITLSATPKERPAGTTALAIKSERSTALTVLDQLDPWRS